MFESLIPPGLRDSILQLDPSEFWLALIVLAAVAIAAFVAIFLFLKRANIVADTPTSRARSAAQGYVELSGFGRLMNGPPIVSPLTGITCTWYSNSIEEWSDGYNTTFGRRSSWRTVSSDTSSDLFMLQDETGVCVIDPDGAAVTTVVKEVWYDDTGDWAPGRPQRRLPSIFGATLFGSSNRYRYTERRMQPNDSLYAIGQFHTVGGAQELPQTDEEVRQLLAEWKRDQKTLLARFDTNHDGVLSMDEWERARQAARQEVLKGQRQRMAGPSINIMRKPDDHHLPYLLSVLPQDQLVRRYRGYAWAALALFLLAGAVCSWMLAVRLAH